MLELMFTVAILAVLIMLAVPVYTRFTVKARVAECINAATQMKTTISEITLNASPPAFPENAETAFLDLQASGELNYCEVARYEAGGVLTIPVNARAVGASGTIEIVMAPALTSGALIWDCRPGATSGENLHYLPANCRS